MRLSHWPCVLFESWRDYDSGITNGRYLPGSTECMKTRECAPLKHHYDECAERVTKQQEETGKAEEDCVEECEYNPISGKLQMQVQRLIQTNRLPHDALRRPVCRP